jgi:plastocyanin
LSSHTRFRAPALVVTALVTLILGLLGVAPAQALPASTSPTTWTVLVGNQSPDMAIQGMRFLPDDITINSGDTVNFVANSAEIHTVSYGTPPLPPTSLANLEADAFTPAGGPVFDPNASWSNSGILATGGPFARSYQLTFNTTGSYKFFCVVHGQMMSAMVHVQPTGTAYPRPQQYYTAQGIASAARILADGYQLWRKTLAQSSPTHVFVGAMDDQAMVMRFIPSIDTVPVGTTVTFDMSANQGLVPHTVTFTSVPSGVTPPDSGLLLGPVTFPVTFTAPGTWNYLCEFHDDMGMVGSVTVTP